MNTPSIGTKELISQLDILLDVNMPVFIHGSPGIGKSYIVNELALQRNWEIRDVRLSQLDPVDLRGIPSIVEGKTQWMSPVFFPDDENSAGILFLDELNSAPPSVQSAVYQLILDRKLGEYSLPSQWRIVCAGNRISDKGVVFRLPSPLSNRMVHLVLEAKFDDFKVWAIENGLHNYIIGFLGFRNELLSQEVPKEHETNPAFATPRSWTMLSKLISSSSAIDSIAPVVYGCVGYASGAEFLNYIKTYKNIPDTDAILEGKSDAVPEEISTLYALCSVLLEKFDLSHTKVLFDYVQKLPVEFNVMLIKDIYTKCEAVAEEESFNAWIEQYGELIV